MPFADTTRRVSRFLRQLGTSAPAHARHVLIAIVLAHWLATLAFALTTRHNGWVYYQGGDQIWSTTSASLIVEGVLPPTLVGYAWATALVPLAAFVGPAYVDFLPVVIGFNVLVLAPVAILAIYALATRIGGVALGLYAAAFWVAAPFVAIPFFRDDYHDRYVEQFLPQALGLTALTDYPSTVCLLVAAYLVVRAGDSSAPAWAAAAGLAAGVGAALKPANLLFLAGPALLLLFVRRPKVVAAYAAGLAPSLALLAIWKARGLGEIPAFAFEQTHVAFGATAAAINVERYVDLDWDHLRTNMAHLREFFYSVRVLQWIPLAGAIAVARTSPRIAALLGAWLAAFVVVKGTAPQATVESGSFFRLLMPAFPAYFLLFAALPLLVPRGGRDTPERRLPGPHRLGSRALVALAVVFVVLPLVAIVVPRPQSTARPESVIINTILTPVNSEIDVRVAAAGERRTVTWAHDDFGPTEVFYRVFRTGAEGVDVSCSEQGSPQCELEMLELTSTRERTYVDESPPKGALYRIGIATNWRDDPRGGDIVAISPPVPATP